MPFSAFVGNARHRRGPVATPRDSAIPALHAVTGTLSPPAGKRCAHYPKTVGDANRADYLAVFDDLRARAAVAGDFYIRVRRFIDEVEGDIVDVYGIVPGEDVAYSLVATPWAEWLGGEVRIEGEVTMVEAAAHCLWEITFLSFDEMFCRLEVEAAVDAINRVDPDAE